MPRQTAKAWRLISACREIFDMLLMALEDLQAGLKQALELPIAGIGDQRGFEGAVHGLVIGDLIVHIGLVEGGTLEGRHCRHYAAHKHPKVRAWPANHPPGSCFAGFAGEADTNA